MRHSVAALLLLVAGGCVDASPFPTTPESATTTTTTLAPSGPLAALVGVPVEDPLLGTGFHTMRFHGPEMIVSEESLTGQDDRDLLAIGVLRPMPATTGIGFPSQLLLAAWVFNPVTEAPQLGVVLYNLGPSGWTVYAAITGDGLLSYLETTTDYQARRPDGQAYANFTVTSFAWSGTAYFLADVRVSEVGAGSVYAGRVECTLGDTLQCALLSDDGVLRSGDAGDAVLELQEALAALGYFVVPPDGQYDAETEEAVRAFQRDYRLTRDGKAGPLTLGLLAEVRSGASEIVLASQSAVGDVPFGTDADAARDAFVARFGPPDAESGWHNCEGDKWNRVTWDGFTAFFTDRSGEQRFDGWHVDDLSNLPSWLYFAGGIRPGTTWAYLEGIGAEYDPAGGFFRVLDFGYNAGRFSVAYPGIPPGDAVVQSFGTGTGVVGGC